MNMRSFVPVACLVCALGGYYVGQNRAPERVAVTDEDTAEYRTKLDQVQNTLQKFTDEDFKNYLRLKEKEEQLIHADEMLGRLMLLILADLGLKVSQNDLEKIKSMASGLPVTPPPPPVPAPVADKTVATASAALRPEENPKTSGVTGPSWPVVQERKLPEVNDRREAKEFLKSVASANLFSAVKYSKSLDPSLMYDLNGTWTGRIELNNEKRGQNLALWMKFENYSEREPTNGSYRITIHRNGKRISNTSGKGEPKDFRSVDGSTMAVIVRVSPTTYVQLYYSHGMRMLLGNYYKQKSIDEYLHEGTVMLQRR